MDQNVNYYGIILLLRQLRESGSFSEKELRKFAEKAGLRIASCETVTRERRPPHFEVISLIGEKP